MKIYTKFGDKGKTALRGKITDKDDARVIAYGEVDELNAMLGVVIAHTKHADIKEVLLQIQKDLFTIGADLSNPQTLSAGQKNADNREMRNISRDLPERQTEINGISKFHQGEKLNRISPGRVGEFEKTIDEIWEKLTPLTHFVLPGGTQTASLLHLARTVCRRAERSIVALSKKEKVNPDIIVYINRLGDLLFTLARFANRKERFEEIIWKGKK